MGHSDPLASTHYYLAVGATEQKTDDCFLLIYETENGRVDGLRKTEIARRVIFANSLKAASSSDCQEQVVRDRMREEQFR